MAGARCSATTASWWPTTAPPTPAASACSASPTPTRCTPGWTSAAKPFKRKGERIQPVYELIVTVADPSPGTDGDYSHDIQHSLVQRYIDAAHRNDALLVLDIQPGRSDFLTVAKRWEWALEDPWVGLALDPEWRMAPDEVPGQTIGQVGAAEINQVSAWLNTLTKSNDLPEKVFMVHQFQSAMIGGVSSVRKRSDLAEVLHVDGFGSPAQKLATYGALAKPRKFSHGLQALLRRGRAPDEGQGSAQDQARRVVRELPMTTDPAGLDAADELAGHRARFVGAGSPHRLLRRQLARPAAGRERRADQQVRHRRVGRPADPGLGRELDGPADVAR